MASDPAEHSRARSAGYRAYERLRHPYSSRRAVAWAIDEVLVLDSVQWRDIQGSPGMLMCRYSQRYSASREVCRTQKSGTATSTCLSPDRYDPSIRIRMRSFCSCSQRTPGSGLSTGSIRHRVTTNLAESKICVNHIRHPGALPTRALEGLAMGCVTAVHDDNVLRLFLDLRQVWSPMARSLDRSAMSFAASCAIGRRCLCRRAWFAVVREAFDLRRVASQVPPLCHCRCDATSLAAPRTGSLFAGPEACRRSERVAAVYRLRRAVYGMGRGFSRTAAGPAEWGHDGANTE